MRRLDLKLSGMETWKSVYRVGGRINENHKGNLL